MKFKSPKHCALRAWLLSAIAGLPTSLFSQAVITVPSTITSRSATPRPGLKQKPTPLSDLRSAFTPLAPPLMLRNLNIRPHLSYTILYGDGILRVPGEPANTTVQELFVGALFEVGKHWTIDYTGGRTWHSTRLFADYTTHNATLAGGIAKGDWTFGVSGSYTSAAHTLVETGRQTPQVSYSTGASTTYEVSDKTLLEVSVTRNTRESELAVDDSTPIQDLEQWSGSASAHYQFSPRLDVALGVSFGSDRIANSADMSTSQPQVTINWRPTDRLSLSAQGGLEIRKFQSGGTDNLETKVYNGSATYEATRVTTFGLSARKSVAPSYFANQVSETTSWDASVQQRLLRRFYLSAGFSRSRTAYLRTDEAFEQGRDDRFNSYTTSLSTTFLSRGSISLTYTKSDNSTNAQDFQFSSHQIGAAIAYRY